MNADESEGLKPLTTFDFVSLAKLKTYVENAEIPDNARMTLKFDRKTGRFCLLFYWSDGPAVLGQRVVDFELESEELCGDAWNWLERD